MLGIVGLTVVYEVHCLDFLAVHGVIRHSYEWWYMG